MRILMVCLGNICRSPVAEGIMRHKVAQHGLPWTVASAGTESYHIGEPPHHFSQKVCAAHGINISAQRAMRFSPAHLTAYDKVYAFAADVHSEIHRMAGKADTVAVDYFLNELQPGTNASVPDPYYGGEEGYTQVYDLIDKTCDAIIEKYKQQHYV